MRKVELLPTRDGEAGYGPGHYSYYVPAFWSVFFFFKLDFGKAVGGGGVITDIKLYGTVGARRPTQFT